MASALCRILHICVTQALFWWQVQSSKRLVLLLPSVCLEYHYVRGAACWCAGNIWQNSYTFFLDISVVLSENLCQGEIIREVVRKQQGYTSCVTASKVPRMECRGGCSNGQCCVPLRSKRRKYFFQCVDGSTFTEELERHVECGCSKCS